MSQKADTKRKAAGGGRQTSGEKDSQWGSLGGDKGGLGQVR